jgi:hypothetical protein
VEAKRPNMVAKVSCWDKFVACCFPCCVSKPKDEVSEVARHSLATHRKHQEAIQEQPKSASPTIQPKKQVRQLRLQSTEWVSVRTSLKYKGTGVVSH